MSLVVTPTGHEELTCFDGWHVEHEVRSEPDPVLGTPFFARTPFFEVNLTSFCCKTFNMQN